MCGAVRYEARGAASYLCYCHCASCRRASGAAFVPWVTFAQAGVRITHGTLTLHRSSPGVLRGFCAACGTSLTFQKDSHPHELDLTLASLDEPAALAPQAHTWVKDKLPWVVIADGLPQYERGMPGP
jgi:hypothetical protein